MLKINKAFEIMGKAALAGMVFLYSFRPVRLVVTSIVGKREPKKWIFILGCYNSGTTILRTLLAGHPEIRVLPREGVRLTSELPRPEDYGWTRMWIGCSDYMTMPERGGEKVMDRIVRDWSPWWKAGGNVFVEKSISNLTRVEWLERNFSNIYFIGITRDGYGVSEGIHRRARPKGEVRRLFGDSYPLEWAAKQWVDANNRLLIAGDMVERYHQISYEKLIEDPESSLREIFNFIGIDQPYELKITTGGVVIDGKNVPLFDGNERSYLRLSSDDFNVITREIAELQHKLGYQIID